MQVATLKDRLKILLGAAIYPTQTRRWKRYVRAHPVLSDLARLSPRITHKIYRPYFSRQLSCKERVSTLIDHYTAVMDAGLAWITREAAVTPISVAEIEGKSGQLIELRLRAIDMSHREGELALQLVMSGYTIYTVGFTLLKEDHLLSIGVGALQGLRAKNGAELVRFATRELHGWRPKNFMIAVVRRLGESLGCTDTILISNRNRIVLNRSRRERISADYDATWQELRASLCSDGNFRLPCFLEQPDLTTVPSHKRSEMRKRHVLLRTVSSLIEQNVRLSAQSTKSSRVLPTF